ncbi:MAG: LAGLIDADG family homing endonuclease [Candidatus Rokubacteria bacterium]|nr:LAGLIDADG family homing endonuclease [Candidatus Rokubacteria bacterium]
MTSADNQQERPDEGLCQYVAGFVDGEGSFHVAFQRSRFTRLGLQVIPEFHVSQNPERAEVLKLIQEVLGCGYIKANHPGSSRDQSVVLVVRNRQDLAKRVLPFFERFPLRSSKQREFQTFAAVVRVMERGEHLTKDGMTQILHQAFAMNSGRYRKRKLQDHLNVLESSETARQASLATERKIQSGLHGDMQRLAEMTSPPMNVGNG